jgi:hypothetical protein
MLDGMNDPMAATGEFGAVHRLAATLSYSIWGNRYQQNPLLSRVHAALWMLALGRVRGIHRAVKHWMP